MEIYKIQSFAGKNIYSHKPVIRMEIDIGKYYDTPTKDIPGLNEKLLNMFPGLRKHYCSLGYEGGFVERLNEGTYIGHVTEHLALELQILLGYDVTYGKTRIISEPSYYYLVFQYENERCAIECGRAAVKILDGLADNADIDIQHIIEEINDISLQSELGPSTKAIFNEAKKRGIPVTRVGNGSLLQLGYGKYGRLMQASLTDSASCISVDMAGNKHLTKQILTENMIPVPKGDVAYSIESAIMIANNIGYPVVIKPFDGNQGKGVTLNINNEKELVEACREAVKYSQSVIVERVLKGTDFRILVAGDKVIAAAERRPPCVIGDGMHNISELIEIENKNILRGEGHEKPLTKIKIDSVTRQVLYKYGIDEKFVPAEEVAVYLRDNANLSTGGTAKDCTDRIHPRNSELAVKAAKALGLEIAGIDMIARDISLPIDESNNGAIIEINAAPGLRMHLSPTEGKPRNVAKEIVDMLFPKGQQYSVPIISVTGTNGKTTTTRLIKHVISLLDKKVGSTTTSGVYIGDNCILKGDNTGPVSAKMVLSNKEVEVAVLETARGGIVRRGLGYDEADVGVIVNISGDHIGLDGVNTIEDLAFVKSLVIEAIKPEGYAVLNADDKMVDYLIKRAVSKVILFSMHDNNELVLNHIKAGGKAVFLKGNSICIQDYNKNLTLIKTDEIPITYKGLLECNIENSLASIAALYALNVPISAIRNGLMSFKPDISLNPGRFNIIDMDSFKIMLDYGHNPAGYEAVSKFLEKTDYKRVIGVIGIPGDRDDKSISEVGSICSKTFSKIFIKEDKDLRGRTPGEVAGILYDSVINGGLKKEDVEVNYSELTALENAINIAREGDLIVMFYEQFEQTINFINELIKDMERDIEFEKTIEKTAG